jgi:lysyl-tRNA synthetase class 2
VAGTGPIGYRDREISFATPFRRLTMKAAVVEAAKAAGLDLPEAAVNDPAALARFAASDALRGRRNHKGVELEPGRYRGLSAGKLLAQLFEDLAEGALFDPTFVTDYPVEISPLAKARGDDPTLAERFELFAAGMEIANGFSELNDPLEQRQRFVEQLEARRLGDAEAHVMDEDYVRALGHGMPPTGGCGVGIDRLAMILTDSPSIRDVILFPQMRPEAGRDRGDEDAAEA